MPLDPEDERELTRLGRAYASCVDDRDLVAMRALFTPDAVLVTPRGTRRGWPAIETAMALLDRYDATFHLLGQSQHWLEADGSCRGETYCVAHHFTASGETGRDQILYLRYHDTFEPGPWRFSRRELEQVWTQRLEAPR